MPLPLRIATPCNLLGGGVSERPKERASKARVGATSPWVQIPPPPPQKIRGIWQERSTQSTTTGPTAMGS